MELGHVTEDSMLPIKLGVHVSPGFTEWAELTL